MAEIIDAGFGFATAGESRAIEALRALPGGWLVVANKVLPIRPGESYEADLIVVGPHQIWLVDEKSYRGNIIGSDQTWTLHGGQSVQSPLNKVDFVAKKLAGWLRDRVAGFPTGRPHPVAGAVLLSGEVASAQINDARARDGLLRLPDAVLQLTKLDRAAQRDGADLRPLHQAIRDTLYKIANRPTLPSEIGPYQVEEEVAKLTGCRVLNARHRDGERRLLYVYDPPSPTVPDRDTITREVTALRALQATGVVPRIGDTFTWSEDHEVVPVHLPSAPAWGALPHPTDVAAALREIDRSAAAFGSLAQVHAARIVHRGLNPTTVIVDDPVPAAAPPRVLLTGLVAARVDGAATIAAALDVRGVDDPYAAPEIARIGSYGFAEPASDVYSLALVSLERLAGVPVRALVGEDGLARPPAAEGAWPYLEEDTISALRGIFQQTLRPGPYGGAGVADVRPSAAEVATALGRIADEARADQTIDKGTVVADRWEILSVLGVGASARTFLVRDRLVGELLAGKQYFQPRNGEAVREFALLWKHKHPNPPNRSSAS